MEPNPDFILDNIQKYGEVFLSSPFFMMMKFLLGIYAAVLFMDIVMLLILRGLGNDLRKTLRGMNVPLVSKSKMQKKWDVIKKKLDSGNSSQFKVAVIEADKIADEILAGIGYSGNDMLERLENVKEGQLSNLEALKIAHQIRNKIIYEEKYELDRGAAEEVLKTYENFLKEVEYL